MITRDHMKFNPSHSHQSFGIFALYWDKTPVKYAWNYWNLSVTIECTEPAQVCTYIQVAERYGYISVFSASSGATPMVPNCDHGHVRQSMKGLAARRYACATAILIARRINTKIRRHLSTLFRWYAAHIAVRCHSLAIAIKTLGNIWCTGFISGKPRARRIFWR